VLPHVVGDREEAVEPRCGDTDVVDQDVEPVAGGGKFRRDRSRPGDHSGAFLNKSAGNRQADAFTRAGHHRELAAQTQFHAHSGPKFDPKIRSTGLACARRAPGIARA